ncbi:MAG: aspartate aminotransferase family protein [Rhodothalassiaceae bacterium]
MTSALMSVYRQADVAFDHGEGCWLYDTDGRRYLDFNAGIAVSSLGHAHPHLVKTLQEQAAKLWHTSNLYRIPNQDRLAERFVAATFADRCFFVNSGVEAIECAIKTARKYFYDKGAPKRNRIITLEGSFHGRSLAAISAAGQEKLVKGFGPLLPGFDRVAPNDLGVLERAIRPETAAILVEPIQGEGGIRPLDDAYMRGLRALADRHGLLLILDEIQCGMGRTGKLFAYEWSGIMPDIVAVAKGIGGGFPLGACLATEDAASGMTPGSHGTTYGGNPLATAVGNAVLDEILKPGFLDHVVAIGDYLKAALLDLAKRHHNRVEDVRGRGLMLGLKLRGIDPRDAVAKALSEGLLIAPAGDNVVRLLPPLIIDRPEVDEAVGLLDRTLGQLDAEAGKTD